MKTTITEDVEGERRDQQHAALLVRTAKRPARRARTCLHTPGRAAPATPLGRPGWCPTCRSRRRGLSGPRRRPRGSPASPSSGSSRQITGRPAVRATRPPRQAAPGVRSTRRPGRRPARTPAAPPGAPGRAAGRPPPAFQRGEQTHHQLQRALGAEPDQHLQGRTPILAPRSRRARPVWPARSSSRYVQPPAAQLDPRPPVGRSAAPAASNRSWTRSGEPSERRGGCGFPLVDHPLRRSGPSPSIGSVPTARAGGPPTMPSSSVRRVAQHSRSNPAPPLQPGPRRARASSTGRPAPA